MSGGAGPAVWALEALPPDVRVDSVLLAAPALSPAMRQYQQFKAQYPGYVLFFRMGDFYEMFWEDAKTAAKTLGVALTSRSRGGLEADDAADAWQRATDFFRS